MQKDAYVCEALCSPSILKALNQKKLGPFLFWNVCLFFSLNMDFFSEKSFGVEKINYDTSLGKISETGQFSIYYTMVKCNVE